MNDWSEYTKFFIGLLAIVNPLGIVPVFIGLTRGWEEPQRRRVASTATITVIVTLVASLLLGEAVLGFFGISFASFRTAGGLLILMIGFSMLHGALHPSKQQHPESFEEVRDRESMAVVPLGLPLLAGPGAISAIIIYAGRGDSLMHYVVLVAEIGVVGLLVLLALRAAPALAGALGPLGISIAERIMGLVTAAIGVEFIANGLRQLFPVLQ